jgi:peptide/nickel transport system permease protein
MSETVERKELSSSPSALIWRRFKRNKVAVTGGILLAAMYFITCFAGFVSPYDFDDTDTSATLAAPALLGGYHPELVAEHDFLDAAGQEITVPEYEGRWRWFNGGVHFHDSEGNFRLRPHVHPLAEYEYYDEYGEPGSVLAVDPEISLPIRFFVRSDEDHEVFSLCGVFPIRGYRHLFGVDTSDPALTDAHVAKVFLLGADRSGRDLMTRILYGGQISLSVGLLGIFVTMTLALLIGGISGYFGGAVDFLTMRAVEILMAIPGLYLILCLRAAFPKGLTSRQTYLMIVFVLALAGWASLGRVIRGMVLSIREEDFATAALAIGATPWRVITRHVLPNTASFVIVTATLYVPYYILGEVALSFLGLGITEPETSWGLLLKDAQNTEILKFHPWLVIPGAFIFLAVLAYNFVGDGLRDAADPRTQLGA